MIPSATMTWAKTLAFYAGAISIALFLPVAGTLLGSQHMFQVGIGTLGLLILFFYVLPPLILFGIDRLCNLAPPRFGRIWRDCVVVGTVFGVAMQFSYGQGVAWRLLILAPVLALAVVAVYRLWNLLEELFSVMGVVSVMMIVPIVYSVSLIPPETTRVCVSCPAQFPVQRGPLFLMIYDGFALEAALDENGKLAPRYRNLGRLEKLGIWTDDATTNYSKTLMSIPSMMSGRFISGSDRALFGADRLFSVLADHYTPEIYGLVLGYCRELPFALCYSEEALSRQHPRLLLRGLLLAYVRVSLPPGAQYVVAPLRTNVKALSVELAHMFIRSVETADLNNRFYFFHTLVPHDPYVLDGKGHAHFRLRDTFTKSLLPRDQLATVLEYYRQELDFVDAHIGRLLDVLEKRGYLSDATIVVTSDHGVSWTWEHRGRPTGYINNQIARIPFFIKPRAGFRYSEVAGSYQHIDLAPTLLDVLGISSSMRVDGTSLFASKRPSREKIALDGGVTWVYDSLQKTWVRKANATAEPSESSRSR